MTEANAHPHIGHGDLALVHGNIIENHEAQRERLAALGGVFESQTDTEVIAHLIRTAWPAATDRWILQAAMEGLTAPTRWPWSAVPSRGRLVCARMGCPLLVGLGEGKETGRRLRCLGDHLGHPPGDLPGRRRYPPRPARAEVRGVPTATTHRCNARYTSRGRVAGLGWNWAYRHFMQKEITKAAMGDRRHRRGGDRRRQLRAELFGARAGEVLSEVTRVKMLACGTATTPA